MQSMMAIPEKYGEGQETFPRYEIVSKHFQELARLYHAWLSSSLFGTMDYSGAGMR